MGKLNIQKAKAAGFTDEQINEYLAANPDVEPNKEIPVLPLEKALYPTSSNMKSDSFVSGAKKAGMGLLDIMGAPVRALAKTRGMEMSDPNATLFRPEIEKVKTKIDKMPPQKKTESTPDPMLGEWGQENFDPEGKKKLLKGATELAGNILSDPTVIFGSLASLAKKPIKSIAKSANKGIGSVAEQLSGVPQKSLRRYGASSANRKAIQVASGTQSQIADDILNTIDDFDNYLPEKTIIDKSLQNMPPIKTTKLIDTLSKSKIQNPVTAGAKTANKKIDELIADINTNFATGEIPAVNYRELRIQFDNELRSAWDKDYKDYIEKAMTKARTTMKNDLIETAKASGKPEYVKAMETYSKKLDAVEQLKKYVGKSSDSRNKRIESFVSNLFGNNSTNKQQIVKELGDVFGKDFIGQSELARIAQDLGPGGVPTLFPKQTTGRSVMGLGTGAATYGALYGSPLSLLTVPATVAMTSPKAAAYTLGGLDKLGPLIANASKVVKKTAGIPAVAQSVKNVYNDPNQEALKKRLGIQ